MIFVERLDRRVKCASNVTNESTHMNNWTFDNNKPKAIRKETNKSQVFRKQIYKTERSVTICVRDKDKTKVVDENFTLNDEQVSKIIEIWIRLLVRSSVRTLGKYIEQFRIVFNHSWRHIFSIGFNARAFFSLVTLKSRKKQ